MDFFIQEVSEQQINRERLKARELRKSRWWAQKCSAGICHYCNRKFAPAELTMDHIVPLARGGLSSRSNVVPACKECNNRKKYLLPIEWEEFLDKLKENQL